MIEFSLTVAFMGGVVSFLSPCVLPIIPGFLAYIAGTSLEDSANHRLKIFLSSIYFVLGFSTVFAILGVALNTILESIAYDAVTWLSRIGGLIIIFFGLYLTGLIRIAYLEREHKISMKRKFHSQFLTSYTFGAAFAAGWTPCVGAVLGPILGLAITEPGSAFALLMSYALGLGLPFIVVGLFASQAAGVFLKYAKYVKYINILFGILLIVIGILIFTGQLARLANFTLLHKILLR